MKTIYKYEAHGGAVVDLPVGAEILTLGVQDGWVYIWALIDPEAPTRPVRFAKVGTGWEAPDPGTYVGTYHEAGGYVWHIFVKEVSDPKTEWEEEFWRSCEP